MKSVLLLISIVFLFIFTACQPPQTYAEDDYKRGLKNEVLIIEILNNDGRGHGREWHFAITNEPSHGTIEVSDDCIITYTPDHDFLGEDSFSYEIGNEHNTSKASAYMQVLEEIPQIEVINTALVVEENMTKEFDILDHEILNKETAYNITISARPQHGTVYDYYGNQLAYKPDENYHGTDQFKYQITSGFDTIEVLVDVEVQDKE